MITQFSSFAVVGHENKTTTPSSTLAVGNCENWIDIQFSYLIMVGPILTPLWWWAMRIGQLPNSHSMAMGRGEDQAIVQFSFCCGGGRWKLDVRLILVRLLWQDVKIKLLKISYKFWPFFFSRFSLLEDGEGFWSFWGGWVFFFHLNVRCECC